MKTYYHAVHPPYENDRLGLESIRDDFEADPVLSQDRDRLIVIGGANLVLRGIIDHTPDVDVLAPKTFLEIMAIYDHVEELPVPRRAREAGATNTSIRFKTQLGGNWVCATDALGDGYYPMSYDGLNQQPGSTEMIEGVRCLSLGRVISSKRALGRERDLVHLEAIKYYQSENWGEPF
ncbi:MAG: hypothetical protein U5L95_02300 [Candidatus Saccharibacteria bacterium]|nr:hypothetical protein [Candidatus Saccharibacteria bacterium]